MIHKKIINFFIQEDGTHDELMAKKGVYFQLVISQQGEEDKIKSTNKRQLKKYTSVDDLKPNYMNDDNGNGDFARGENWILEEENNLAANINPIEISPFGRSSLRRT